MREAGAREERIRKRIRGMRSEMRRINEGNSGDGEGLREKEM